MRIAYSILREILHKKFIPKAKDYGIKTHEFDRMIYFLEKEGYLERVLRASNGISLKPALVTEKGKCLLIDNRALEKEYPERGNLKKWVEEDKKQWSNNADD